MAKPGAISLRRDRDAPVSSRAVRSKLLGLAQPGLGCTKFIKFTLTTSMHRPSSAGSIRQVGAAGGVGAGVRGQPRFLVLPPIVLARVAARWWPLHGCCCDLPSLYGHGSSSRPVCPTVVWDPPESMHSGSVVEVEVVGVLVGVSTG